MTVGVLSHEVWGWRVLSNRQPGASLALAGSEGAVSC